MTNKTFMGFDIWFSNQPIFTHANKNETNIIETPLLVVEFVN